jgi:hypothetical protein
MITAEKASQKSITVSRRSVHHTSFLYALVQEFVRSTTQRLVVPSGSGFPFSEIFATKRRSASFGRIVLES